MNIPLVEFGPLARPVPQIGFGCARIVGRSSLRQSAKLIECALDLGIRYFDVAPVYGLGTAEEVLGEVIGNRPDVVIATKVGIPRPPYSARANLLRRFAKPVLDRARGIKTIARKFYAPKAAMPGAEKPRFDFSESSIRNSIEDSLRRLRRDRIDVYLLHEPRPDDLTADLSARLAALVQSRQISSFGVGIDAQTDRWTPFGSIWQSGWPGERVQTYSGDVAYVFHGAIRHAPKDHSGATIVPAGRLVGEAMRLAPRSIILVSTSTTRNLCDIVEGALATPDSRTTQP